MIEKESGEILKENDNDERSSSSMRINGISSEYKQLILTAFACKNSCSSKRLSSSNSSKRFGDELTINKLRLGSIGFYGRNKETKLLKESLDRQVEATHTTTTTAKNINNRSCNNNNKQMVVISGYSGVGKTTLANSVLMKYQSIIKKKGIYVSGKFDLDNSNEPFSAISAAYGEICQHILTIKGDKDQDSLGDDTLVKNIEDAILAELKTEISLLSALIPNFDKIITKNCDGVLSSSVKEDNMTDRRNLDAIHERVKYAFRLFTRLLSSFFAPFVVMLDDLQWADVSTLDLVIALLNDTQNPNSLMIIGCYRSNEVDEEHIISRKIRQLQDEHNASNLVEVTEIKVGNFGIEEVNQVIMALLSIDDEETRTIGLAEICYKRTNGNPFFLIEFVKMLEEEGLLTFNLCLLKWEWSDIEMIEEKTMATANVVGILQAKMKKMSKMAQILLQYAACLGSSFKTSTICRIWQKQVTSSGTKPFKLENDALMIELLALLVKESFIECCGPYTYRWVHDKIQESALSLVGVENLSSFQYDAGVAWYQDLSKNELDIYLFDIVNLINKVDSTNVEYAELNLRAAVKAMSISAFVSAAKYVSKGISYLPIQDKWNEHRYLTLNLYSAGAEIAGFLGRRETMNTYCNEVLGQCNISTLEKIRVYDTRLKSLSAQKKHEEAIEESLVVLESLGCTFPRTAAGRAALALPALLRTIKLAKNTPADAFESLPLIKDPKKMAAANVFERLAYASAVAGHFFMIILFTTRVTQLTLSDGVCKVSPTSLVTLATFTQSILGDFDTAYYFAERALKMLDTHNMVRDESRVLYFAYEYIICWTKPIQSVLYRAAHQGYDSGMRTGNIESAMWNLVGRSAMIPYALGKPLGTMEAECRLAASQMKDLQQEDHAEITRVFWQSSLNLIGHSSSNTTVLTGEAFDEDEFIASKAYHIKGLQYVVFLVAKNVLCNWFGNFEQGADVAIQKGDDYSTKMFGHFLLMLDTFHRGISLYAMARKTKKRRYKKAAKKPRRIINGWIKKGNPNVKHYACLLNAEHAALNRKNNRAKKMYQEAIAKSVRCGFLHDAALANERYADFLLNVCSEKGEATYCIEEATRFYQEWGADHKVALLREELSAEKNIENESAK